MHSDIATRDAIFWHSDAVKTCERFAKLNNPLRLRYFCTCGFWRTRADRAGSGQWSGHTVRFRPQTCRQARTQSADRTSMDVRTLRWTSPAGHECRSSGRRAGLAQNRRRCTCCRNRVHHNARHQQSNSQGNELRISAIVASAARPIQITLLIVPSPASGAAGSTAAAPQRRLK
jgi:hypothetical protein